MDRLKQQLQDIQQQLSGLSASQKMLALSLVAIMAVTVVWWTSYAASGETVRLLEQPLEPEQLGQIRQTLSGSGIPAEVVGDGVMVPATRRDEAVAMLALERKLPGDLTRHFDKALGQIGSFDPHKKIDLTILAARQDALASTIARWPGVRHASIHVNDRYKRQVGGDIMPTAGITLSTTGSGGESPQKLAESATHFVAGAFAMLIPDNIEVIVDGRLVSISGPDSVAGSGNKLLELQAAAESRFEKKLLRTFSYIPGLRVAVAVDVKHDTTRRVVEQVDPDQKFIAPLETREESNEEQTASGDWGEAGLRPNAALSLNRSGAAGDRSDRRVLEERNRVEVGMTREETYSRGGVPVATSCTLSLPLSWIRNEFAGRNPDVADPTAEALRTFENDVRQEIANAARTLLSSVDPDKVMVVTYADAGGVAAGPLAATTADVATDAAGGAMASVTGLLSDYGRPAVVVLLAAVALLFVSSIAKKGGAAVTTSQPLGSFDPAELAALASRASRPRRGNDEGEDTVLDALGADPLLVGQEVAEEQLQVGQMVDQVQGLVKENPDAAAGLIKQWIENS